MMTSDQCPSRWRCVSVLLPKQGLVDLVDRKAYSFEGPNGDSVVEAPVPASMAADVELYRSRLVEAVRDSAFQLETGLRSES
jgi:hypothetical protein